MIFFGGAESRWSDGEGFWVRGYLFTEDVWVCVWREATRWYDSGMCGGQQGSWAGGRAGGGCGKGAAADDGNGG